MDIIKFFENNPSQEQIEAQALIALGNYLAFSKAAGRNLPDSIALMNRPAVQQKTEFDCKQFSAEDIHRALEQYKNALAKELPARTKDAFRRSEKKQQSFLQYLALVYHAFDRIPALQAQFRDCETYPYADIRRKGYDSGLHLPYLDDALITITAENRIALPHVVISFDRAVQPLLVTVKRGWVRGRRAIVRSLEDLADAIMVKGPHLSRVARDQVEAHARWLAYSLEKKLRNLKPDPELQRQLELAYST